MDTETTDRKSSEFPPPARSIPNPSTSWADQYRRLSSFGFVSEIPILNSPFIAGYLAHLLSKHGPFMLSHLTVDLLAGDFLPDNTHAVVITGIDILTGEVWFNNPWGDVDELTTVERVVLAMRNLAGRGVHVVAYIP